MFPFPLLTNDACSSGSIKSLAAPRHTGAPPLLVGHRLPKQVHWPSQSIPNILTSRALEGLRMSPSQRETGRPAQIHLPGGVKNPKPYFCICPWPSPHSSILCCPVLLLAFSNPSANIHLLLCHIIFEVLQYASHPFRHRSRHHSEQAGKLPSCLIF